MWDSIRFIGCVDGVAMAIVNLAEEGIVEVCYEDYGHLVIHMGPQITLPKGRQMIQFNYKKFIGKKMNMWIQVYDVPLTCLRNECMSKIDELEDLVGKIIMPEREL